MASGDIVDVDSSDTFADFLKAQSALTDLATIHRNIDNPPPGFDPARPEAKSALLINIQGGSDNYGGTTKDVSFLIRIHGKGNRPAAQVANAFAVARALHKALPEELVTHHLRTPNREVEPTEYYTEAGRGVVRTSYRVNILQLQEA